VSGVVGSVVVWLAGCAAAAGLAVCVWRPGKTSLIRRLQIGAAALACAALVLLAALMLQDPATIAYAAENAAPRDSSLGYRIAAVWAGQQGGLLLWIVETALIGLVLRPSRHPRAIAVMLAIEACLLAVVALGAPFAPVSPDAQPPGLNPLLLDRMMLIHPPMLFLGYALLALPFALTVGALVDGAPLPWVSDTRRPLLVAWLALTAGNGFGASWAYRTFGWGGFWSWDPVENTSFVPWLLCGVAVHGLWLSRRDAAWRRSTAVLALAGFITVLYGSFLARSGLLAGDSVHAYVEGRTLYVWALGSLLAGAVVVAITALAIGWRSWIAPPPAGPAPAGTSAGMWALVGIVAIVLLGMSLPIRAHRPPPSAFNAAALPFAFVALGLLAVRSRRGSGWTWAQRAVLIVAVAGSGLAVFVATRLGPEGGMLAALPLVFAPLTVLAAVIITIRAAANLVTSPRTLRSAAAEVAHIGLALLMVGAIISGYRTASATTFIPAGETRTIGAHEVGVTAVGDQQDGEATVSVNGRRGAVRIESHERFEIELRHAHISRRWWGDIYLTPMAVLSAPMEVAGGEVPPGAMLEVSLKPAMPLLWSGMVLIALGLVMALWGRTSASKRAGASPQEVGATDGAP